MRINRVMFNKPQTACSAAFIRRSKEAATFLIEIVPHFSGFVKFPENLCACYVGSADRFSLYVSECSDVVTIFAVCRMF
jgi:hypothetical protein